MNAPAPASSERVESEEVTFTVSGMIEGARQGVPLAISFVPFGAVFGVMARQAGLTFGEATLMTLIVYAGASQFIALGLWVPPLSIANIILTSSIVNLRYLLMGAALRPWFSKLSPLKAYGSIFFISDGSWAMAMREFASGKRDGAYLLGSSLAQFVALGSATVVGYVLGAAIKDPARWGLDFVATAVFAALLVDMWKGKSDLLPWLSSATVAVVCAQWLPGKWYVLAGGLVGSLIGAFGDEN
jgi:4-azaleucine resistance transporter AzlC